MGSAVCPFQLLCFIWTEQEILFVQSTVVYAWSCPLDCAEPRVSASACVSASVCVCVRWPCPVSPLLLDKESHLSLRIVLAFHLRRSLKCRIITQPSDRTQSVKPRPTSIPLFPSPSDSFSSWLRCLSVRSFETTAKMWSLLRRDSKNDAVPRQWNKHGGEG